jgi:hypothetical protein
MPARQISQSLLFKPSQYKYCHGSKSLFFLHFLSVTVERLFVSRGLPFAARILVDQVGDAHVSAIEFRIRLDSQ